MNVLPLTVVQIQLLLWETKRGEDEWSREKFRQTGSGEVNKMQENINKRDKELEFRDRKVELHSQHHLVKNIQTVGKFTSVLRHNMMTFVAAGGSRHKHAYT